MKLKRKDAENKGTFLQGNKIQLSTEVPKQIDRTLGQDRYLKWSNWFSKESEMRDIAQVQHCSLELVGKIRTENLVLFATSSL